PHITSFKNLSTKGDMTELTQADFSSQLELAQSVKSQFGSHENWRDWGHLMEVVQRMTTGQPAIDLRTGQEYENDPVRMWMRNREKNVQGSRTLESLSSLGGVMSTASRHLQKF